MSGVASWDASAWFWAAASGLLILLGLLSLLHVLFGGTREARAEGWDLRHGRSVDLASRWMSSDLLPALLLVGTGTFQLLHDPDTLDTLWLTGLGLFLIALSAFRFFEDRVIVWWHQRHRARLASRHARGEDAYFEELRALEAYPPGQIARRESRLEVILILLCGSSLIAAAITR